MRRLAAVFMFVLAPAALFSCSDSPTGPAEVNIEGTWTGSVDVGTFTLTIAQDGSDLSGSGNVSNEGGSIALNFTGTRSGTSISLNITSSGFQDLDYSGTIQSSTRITGTLHGSGFQGESLTLTR